MTDIKPILEESISAEGAPMPSWDSALERLKNEPGTAWLATVRPDGRPHVMPVGAIWLDGALYFNTGATTRKGRNLAREPYCVLTLERTKIHLVVEGKAVKVMDEAKLQRVADGFAAQGWHPTVRDGSFYAEYAAPSAPPPPWDVYEVAPDTIFGLPTEGHHTGAARWSF